MRWWKLMVMLRMRRMVQWHMRATAAHLLQRQCALSSDDIWVAWRLSLLLLLLLLAVRQKLKSSGECGVFIRSVRVTAKVHCMALSE